MNECTMYEQHCSRFEHNFQPTLALMCPAKKTKEVQKTNIQTVQHKNSRIRFKEAQEEML